MNYIEYYMKEGGRGVCVWGGLFSVRTDVTRYRLSIKQWARGVTRYSQITVRFYQMDGTQMYIAQ